MQSALETKPCPEAGTPGPREAWERAVAACDALRRSDPPVVDHRRALLGFMAPGGPLPGTAEALAALEPDAWTDVAGYANSEWTRLGPLTHERLRAAGLNGRLPADAAALLAAGYASTRAMNVQRRQHLAELLRGLARDGLAAAVLKGPYMAEHVYPDAATRPMSDIDLFVPRDALAPVERALLALGCGPDAEWRPSVEWSLSTNLWLLPMGRADGSAISVHWTIEDPRSPFAIDSDALYARTRPVRLAGEPARILSPEDYLLHLCLHASYRHGFETPARCYQDIVLMIGHFGARVSWDVLVARAHEWGCPRLVFAPLEIARALFGGGVPDGVLPALGPAPHDADAVRVAVQHTLRGPERGTRAWRTARRVLDAWMNEVAGPWPLPGW